MASVARKQNLLYFNLSRPSNGKDTSEYVTALALSTIGITIQKRDFRKLSVVHPDKNL